LKFNHFYKIGFVAGLKLFLFFINILNFGILNLLIANFFILSLWSLQRFFIGVKMFFNFHGNKNMEFLWE